MVVAAQDNLVGTGADRADTFVADTGYWSIPNATLDIDADALITPMARAKRSSGYVPPPV
jgi:hypothetical protein